MSPSYMPPLLFQGPGDLRTSKGPFPDALPSPEHLGPQKQRRGRRRETARGARTEKWLRLQTSFRALPPPALPRGKEQGTSQTVRKGKKSLMVDKYFITET